MSQENLTLVHRGFEAYNNRDLDALMENFTEDVEWRLIGGFADLMGSEFRGREALRLFFGDWLANLGGGGGVESVREVGNRVVAIVRTVGIGGASGAPASMRWGQVYSFRDEKVSAVDNYYEAKDALEAVGLRE